MSHTQAITAPWATRLHRSSQTENCTSTHAGRCTEIIFLSKIGFCSTTKGTAVWLGQVEDDRRGGAEAWNLLGWRGSPSGVWWLHEKNIPRKNGPPGSRTLKTWCRPEPNWPSHGRPHPAKGGRINDCGLVIVHVQQKKNKPIFIEWIRTWPSYKNTSHEKIKYSWTRNYSFWNHSVWITIENSIISLYSLLIILTKSQYKII